MKTGKTLNDLAAEILRQSKARRDFVMPTRNIKTKILQHRGDDGSVSGYDVCAESEWRNDQNEMDSFVGVFTDHAKTQLAQSYAIPESFLDRLGRYYPAVAEQMLGRMFEQENKRRFVRVLDSQIRAWLSDRYRPLDNAEVAEYVIPALAEWEPASLELTDTRLYMKFLHPSRAAEVRVGDAIRFGVVITNSEVGAGALSVRPFFNRLQCTNGMIAEYTLREVHAGSRMSSDAGAWMRDETRAARDRATMMELRDTIDMVAAQDSLDHYLAAFKAAAQDTIQVGTNIEKVLDVTAKQYGLGVAERASVLGHLAHGGDLTRWGLANAVTRLAQDTESYDRATDLESIGGKIIFAPPETWHKIANAA